MRQWAAVFVLAIFAASGAWADGDGPTRKMNGPEAADFQALRKTVREALPKPPADYTVKYDGFGEREVPAALAPGGMLWMNFQVDYKPDPAVAASRMQAAVMGKVQGTPAQQAKIASLDAREKALYEARKAARDPREKDRIRAELKAVRAEERALRDEIDAQYQEWVRSGGAAGAMKEAGDSALPHLSVQVRVNQDMYIPDTSVPYAVQGVPLAFEQRECDFGKYCVTVLIGPFEKAPKGRTQYDLRKPAGGTLTRARGMGIFFSASREKPDAVRELVKKTDFGKLKALVAN